MYVESAVGLTGHRLMEIGMQLLKTFTRNAMYMESILINLNTPADVRVVLKQLAADRVRREVFHKDKLEVASAIEKPYEINSLLRYPIAKYHDEYYAPYPELIGYASGRGLFFRFSEEHKQAFRDPFAKAMEEYTAQLLRDALPQAKISHRRRRARSRLAG